MLLLGETDVAGETPGSDRAEAVVDRGEDGIGNVAVKIAPADIALRSRNVFTRPNADRVARSTGLATVSAAP
jgi:hypothetical protein